MGEVAIDPRELRLEVRRLDLATQALASLIGGDRVREAVHYYKFDKECPVIKCGLPAKGLYAIEGHVDGDSRPSIVTLEDLTLYTRDEIAAIDGVGPKAMKMLDAAMAERGLTWAGAA